MEEEPTGVRRGVEEEAEGDREEEDEGWKRRERWIKGRGGVGGRGVVVEEDSTARAPCVLVTTTTTSIIDHNRASPATCITSQGHSVGHALRLHSKMILDASPCTLVTTMTCIIDQNRPRLCGPGRASPTRPRRQPRVSLACTKFPFVESLAGRY